MISEFKTTIAYKSASALIIDIHKKSLINLFNKLNIVA